MMEQRTLEFIAESCNGQLVAGERFMCVSRVCTDSRLVKPGDLFVAIEGDRFDGHDYASQALDQGAGAAMVNRSWLGQALVGPAIHVNETRQALGQLAKRYRQDFDIPVIAVGGSNGKTTTKDILATLLGRRFKTLSSEASFNNDVGVPLTLLRLQKLHRTAVVEVGSNHPGEMEALLSFVRPTIGVLTSIGREHLEFFDNLDGVIREEGSLAGAVPEGGVLFVNGDIEGLKTILERCCARVVTVGESEGCDWRLVNIKSVGEGVEFEIISPKGDRNGVHRVNLLGRHNAQNAAIAMAVAAELGLSQEELNQGLQDCRPASMRMQMQTLGGVCVINDAYNSNPDSLQAALETLNAFPVKGKVIAVLGDMAELGELSESAHVEAGERVAKLGLSGLIAVGQWADDMVRAAQASGLANVAAFDDAVHAGKALSRKLTPGDVVLVKGSRSAKMERVLESLKEELQP